MPPARAPGPVRMGQVGDAAGVDDPVAGGGEVAALARELGRVALDADPEHVAVAVLGQEAVELDARQHDEVGARRRLAAVPVVCERDDVVAGAPVVPCKRARRKLAVGVARVHVECRLEPVSGRSPGRVHAVTLLQSGPALPTIAGTRPRLEERSVEDFQEQEYEFLRRLDEERFGRRTLLKRGLAIGAGLTIISLPEAALAARAKALADPPLRGTKQNLSAIVAAAKKEGRLNVIALPPDWANYGEIISTFTKKYGIPITSDNPNGSSSEENQAIVSLKGDPRAPDVVDVNPTFAVAGTVSGLYGRYYVRNYKTVPRAMKDTRGFWTGDYYGSVTIGYNANVVKTPPKSFADLLKPIYKNQVALNGSPLTSGSAIAGVFAAALANGGSLSNVGPGVDWFAKARAAGNYIPVETTPQTVASGQTPILIDWDYNNFAYVKEFPSANGRSSSPPTVSTPATTARRSARPRRTRGPPACGRSSSTPTRGRSCT